MVFNGFTCTVHVFKLEHCVVQQLIKRNRAEKL